MLHAAAGMQNGAHKHLDCGPVLPGLFAQWLYFGFSD